MKVNLTVKGENISGYVNIDASTGGDIVELKEIDNAEAKEIIASDVINFVAIESLELLVQGWIKKLRHGGKIVIGGIEINEVCKAFIHKAISCQELNQFIHNGRMSHVPINELEKILINQGLIIEKKRIDNFNMIIEARRP